MRRPLILSLVLAFQVASPARADELDFYTGSGPARYMGGFVFSRSNGQTVTSFGGVLFPRKVTVSTTTPEGPVVTRFTLPSPFHSPVTPPFDVPPWPMAAPAAIRVAIPEPAGVVYVEGQRVSGRGLTRFLESTPVPMGREIPLRIRAAWLVGDEVWIEDKIVVIRAGTSLPIVFDGRSAPRSRVDRRLEVASEPDSRLSLRERNVLSRSESRLSETPSKKRSRDDRTDGAAVFPFRGPRAMPVAGSEDPDTPEERHMGATMERQTIIYGEQHAVALQSFTDSAFNDILKVICAQAGPMRVDLSRAKNAVKKSLANKKMKDTAYVKVGVVKGNLVLRCKEKKFLGDIEEDGLLVKNWAQCVARWKASQKDEKSHEESEGEKVKPGAKPQPVKTEWKPAVQTRRPQAPILGRKVPPTDTPPDDTPDDSETEAPSESGESRIQEILTRKPEGGESIADRMKRAVEKSNKLGLTPESKKRMEKKGLRPMKEQYHGEVLDHQRNRYGGFLEYLRKIWVKEASGAMNFSEWLDECEKNNLRTPGVEKGRAILESRGGQGKIKDTAGEVTYLDDTTRADYVCTANKGTISGRKIGSSGEFIFVVGPDSKIYAGVKARAKEGESGAFNHSSFFSGGAVKSAGTIIVQGGRIICISNVSGHYAPDEAMIRLACTRFSGGDRDCLQKILVKIGNKRTTAAELLGFDPQSTESEPESDQRVEALKNHPAYHGELSGAAAQALLKSQPVGAWLLRYGKTGVTVTVKTTTKFTHSLIGVDTTFEEVESMMKSRGSKMVRN